MGAYISKDDLENLSQAFLKSLKSEEPPKEIEMQVMQRVEAINNFQLDRIKIGDKIAILGKKSRLIKEKIMFEFFEDNPTVIDIEERSALERSQKMIFDDNRAILIKEVEYPGLLSQFEDYRYIFIFKYSLEYTIRNLYKAFAKGAFSSYNSFKDKITNLDNEECIVINNINKTAFIYKPTVI